jgi:Ca2+:H+ antiporter
MSVNDGLASPGLLQRTQSVFSGAVSARALLPSWETYHEVRTAYRTSRVNLLLILVPIAISAGALGWSPVAVFCLNFLAIIPLAPLIWLSVVELSALLGQYSGGILRATCVNAVEMIVS